MQTFRLPLINSDLHGKTYCMSHNSRGRQKKGQQCHHREVMATKTTTQVVVCDTDALCRSMCLVVLL
jgi:hypothetical protein